MSSRSKSLQYYVLVRLLLAPLMLLTITTVVFLLLRATPGDPVDAVLGVRAPESVKQEYRERLGLLDPLWLQYIRYLATGEALLVQLMFYLAPRAFFREMGLTLPIPKCFCALKM